MSSEVDGMAVCGADSLGNSYMGGGVVRTPKKLLQPCVDQGRAARQACDVCSEEMPF